MREVALDTETTGLDPDKGDRIVEIGCVELINHIPTGDSYHTFVNPERAMSAGATEVSGITDEQLTDKPLFSDIADDFLAFLGDAPLVIHNAAFDLKFINAELARLSRPPIEPGREIDTVLMARRKFPRAPANLDALCRRFEIDLSGREKHGALIDAELLAAVYLELVGGRQHGLSLVSEDGKTPLKPNAGDVDGVKLNARPKPLASALTDEDKAAHETFIDNELGDEPLWRKFNRL